MFDNNSIIIWIEVCFNRSDPTICLPRSVRSCAINRNMKLYIRHIDTKWVTMTLGGYYIIALNHPKIWIKPKYTYTQIANIGT